ncbi:MAG TPA: hypothetical protein VFS47_13435 [Steroidobacteraceae bacterium]|jgi:hypothetical protein|nr:hypothetical protein [Steroidobacteraceae bacterium]
MFATEIPPPLARARSKPIRSRARVQIDPKIVLDAEVMRVAPRGVSFVLPRKLEEQQSCSFDMNLFVEGSVRRLRGVGRIVSCFCAGMDGFRVAMQFTDLDEDSAAALEALLARG